MTRGEYAVSKGLTLSQLNQEQQAYLQCEGYDDAGRVYETLDAWLARKPVSVLHDPQIGGRGVGQYGLGER